MAFCSCRSKTLLACFTLTNGRIYDRIATGDSDTGILSRREDEPIRYVIYARFSSDGQRAESVEGQLRECKEYAERHNMTLVSVYIDRALSARSDDRPEFQKMIRDSAKKQFDVVLVWKLDRFSRNRLDAATYRAILKRNALKLCQQKRIFQRGRKA